MENVLKMVYGNQKEVKLESQVFELSLADDLVGLIKRGQSIEKRIQKEIVSYNGFLRAGNEFKSKYAKLVKTAKEVGFPIPTELKKLENIADEFIKKGEALRKVSNLL